MPSPSAGLEQKTPQKVQSHYDSWAASYDDDVVNKHNYIGHKKLAMLANKYLSKNAKILNVGAGTGLDAYELKKNGYYNIDGHDGSEKMLEAAESRDIFKNSWQEMLEPNKLSKHFKSKHYDAVVNLGCFIPGCLDERHLNALIDPVKAGGIVIIGTREVFLSPPPKDLFGDFSIVDYPYYLERRIQNLQKEGVVQILERYRTPNYLDDFVGVFFVLRVL